MRVTESEIGRKDKKRRRSKEKERRRSVETNEDGREKKRRQRTASSVVVSLDGSSPESALRSLPRSHYLFFFLSFFPSLSLAFSAVATRRRNSLLLDWYRSTNACLVLPGGRKSDEDN